MINFRFHVVSIVAVFLALTIGIVIGSTIVDQAIVDQLRSRIDDVDAKAEETRDENEQLKSALERQAAYLGSMAPFSVDGRLAGDAVAIIAERGIDADVVAAEQDLAEAAGVAAPLVVWIEADAVADGVPATEFAEELGVALAERRAAAPIGSDTTTTTDATAPGDTEFARLAALADAGRISIDDDAVESFLASLVGRRRAIVLGGAESVLADRALLEPLAAALHAEGIETVVGEVFLETEGGDSLDRGVLLAPIVTGDLGDAVATVDDVDEAQGRVSVVLALEEVVEGTVGHYGFGSGARRSTPEWSAA